MAYSTIPKGSSHMNLVLYTGNGSSQAVNTGIDLTANGGLVVAKNRNATNKDWYVLDTIRGLSKTLHFNGTGSEQNYTTGVTGFNNNGFQVGSATQTNGSGNLLIGYNWKAGTSVTGSANTDGSISSTVSANTTSGFSIVKYTGTGSTATIGHGLGIIPKIILIKSTSNGSLEWRSYFSATGNTKYMVINQPYTVSGADSSFMNNTSPTDDLFTVGSSSTPNENGGTYIAYCFADVKGFSKMGGYTGSASTDGTFVYCGFKPSFIFTKATATGEGWQIYDSKRLGVNATEKVLYPNTAGTEATLTGGVDFLSNGFKWRTADGGVNSSQLYVYMAFAENPFVATSGTNAVPVTAR